MYVVKWIIGSLALVALLTGCIYVPKVVHKYDSECQIMVRQAELEVSTVNHLLRCEGERCAGALVSAGLVSTGSAIISGSIVLVSNTVYWFEKNIDCRSARRAHASELADQPSDA
ncbi:hypothetical protein [Gilvimarinus sp. 1_MG-2023]|uniref:hypothetical protein n=1 Tax=Gilvimarinus sp. 1_MG-2023 TaxID=3062638 RepID=UPI0026E3276F|nr:hypothetical protein [Gilvimarinus sp. 1_MG-2023]MDO6746578.1 hypothetical protein [Gilvimarinus sp. 1_MG-2023]